jgi:solute carrier family 25 (mitochondrial phosphate transporter), member 23/24/25/41
LSKGKDFVEETDVRDFAKRNNLPEAYVNSFYANLRKSATLHERGVTFDVFKRFVSSREQALRRVFDTLDAGALAMVLAKAWPLWTRTLLCALLTAGACLAGVHQGRTLRPHCITDCTSACTVLLSSSKRTASNPAHASADRDGKITPAQMRIGLQHLLIQCPNSRCCYRPHSSCTAIDNAVMAVPTSRANKVTFCGFRKFFLLLPPDKLIVEYWLKAGDPACCDVGCPVPYSDAQRKQGASPWGHLLAGAMAGAVSRTATAPLETMRLMAMTGTLQASHSSGGVVAAAGALVRRHGWRALYRGNLTNVARSAPQKALDFFAFDIFKNALAPSRAAMGATAAASTAAAARSGAPRMRGGARGGHQQQLPALPAPEGAAPAQLGTGATLVAAGLAGAASNVVLYPLEVVRTRLSTDSAAAYKGIGDALRTIVRVEGVPALYRCVLSSSWRGDLCSVLGGSSHQLQKLRVQSCPPSCRPAMPSSTCAAAAARLQNLRRCRGLVPSVAAILPEAAITYGLFDLLKRGYCRWSGRAETGVVPSLAAGVTAAFIGQVVAYPLETVSRCMQARARLL